MWKALTPSTPPAPDTDDFWVEVAGFWFSIVEPPEPGEAPRLWEVCEDSPEDALERRTR